MPDKVLRRRFVSFSEYGDLRGGMVAVVHLRKYLS